MTVSMYYDTKAHTKPRKRKKVGYVNEYDPKATRGEIDYQDHPI